jgi:glutathione peroxidase-family protein
LYAFLTSKETNPKFGGRSLWNFTKFLVTKKATSSPASIPAKTRSLRKSSVSVEAALAKKK